jgi:hypothetical protein
MATREDERDLPVTWPFTVAAVLVVAALIWFCGHFAVRDPQATPPTSGFPHPFAVFWGLILAAVFLIVCGGAFNVVRERRRRRALEA